MPRQNTAQSRPKGGDNQPVKDFDYNMQAADSKTLAVYALKASGGVSGVTGDKNLFSYLKNPGELEKAILKKGMTKAEAA